MKIEIIDKNTDNLASDITPACMDDISRVACRRCKRNY